MKIEVRHDHHVEANARLIDYIQTHLSGEFARHAERLTHLEVHLSDENAGKHGEHDKKCMIEARLAGLKPVAVTAKGDTIEKSLDCAVDKLHHLLDHQEGKANAHRHEGRDRHRLVMPMDAEEL